MNIKEIEENQANYSSDQIIEFIDKCSNKKDKLKLFSLMRAKIAQEERIMREELKKENADTQKEKNLLKSTQIDLIEKRKEFTNTFRAMNAIINGKSMLKHLGDFSKKVKVFKEKSKEFDEALDKHLSNLATIKRKSNG